MKLLMVKRLSAIPLANCWRILKRSTGCKWASDQMHIAAAELSTTKVTAMKNLGDHISERVQDISVLDDVGCLRLSDVENGQSFVAEWPLFSVVRRLWTPMSLH